MQRIIHFIKYNNGFIIIFGMVFLLTSSTFASEKVRSTVIGEAIEEMEGVDNSALLALDVQNAQQGIRITDVSEDTDFYYVQYSFSTFDIKDNMWQDVVSNRVLKIAKEALGGTIDIGLYVQNEFSQIMDTHRVYLTEVQEKERTHGKTVVTKTKKYTGLKGLLFDPETHTLDGYTPKIVKFEREETPFEDTRSNEINIEVLIDKNTQRASVESNATSSKGGMSDSLVDGNGTTTDSDYSSSTTLSTSDNTVDSETLPSDVQIEEPEIKIESELVPPEERLTEIPLPEALPAPTEAIFDEE